MKNIEPDVNRIKGLCFCNFNSVLLRCRYGDGEHTCSFVCLWFLQAFVIDCHGTFKYTPGVICWFSTRFWAHAYKNAKVNSLMAELQQSYPHANIVSHKVGCAIIENSQLFFPLCGFSAATLTFILICDRLNVSHQSSCNLQCKIKTNHG